jgi:hypothetical protein
MKSKKERIPWINSKSYLRIKEKIETISNNEKEKRKELHNRFINQLLQYGNVFHLEKLSYIGLQKLFGKSIGAKAPGLFVELLKKKSINQGGYVYEFNTRTTFLSQVCTCGIIKKKSLSQRFNNCDCGNNHQRDLFSAYLALFVNKDNKTDKDYMDIKVASKQLSGFDNNLYDAVLK